MAQLQDFTNKEALQQIINSISDGIIVISSGGSFQLVNPAAKRIAGIVSNTATLEEWSSNYGLFNPETKKPFPKENLPLVRAIQGEATDNIELYILNDYIPSGAYILASGRPFYNENQEVIGGMVVIRDITIRREAELAIRKSEEKYRVLFQNSNDAIYITTMDGTILEVNEAFLRLFGYTDDEITGMSAKALYFKSIDRDNFIKEIYQKKELKNYQIQLVKKNGEALECLLSSTVRLDKNGAIVGFQGIIRDVSIYKRSDELRKQKELAEKSASFKDRFLANMSHEIRTPLNGILGMTNLLVGTSQDDKQQYYTKSIRNSSEHLLELVNDILDFSKIEAGKIEFQEVPFSLREVMTNSREGLALKAHEKGIKLDFVIDDKVPEIIVGDPVKLNQVLYNLIGNAVKFTDEGGVKILVKTIEETTKKVSLHFSVVDTGIGIAANRIENIFNSFTQLMNSNNQKTTGTGLGLSITKQLIELQDGSISVKSEIGLGSTFTFLLKYKKHEQSTQQVFHFSAGNEVDIFDIGEKNFLLVEDHVINQEVAINTFLSWWPNVQIDLAENGKIALELLRINDYDLVLMDIQLPEMDGHEATQKIRAEFKPPKSEVPILAMTAHATTAEAEKCFSSGMNDYLSKPFKPRDLHNKIVGLLFENYIDQDAPIIEAALPKNQPSESLDLSYMEDLTNNQDSFMLKMIDLFIQETPKELEDFELAFEQSNRNRMRAIAHKLKSSTKLLGLTNTSKLCEDVEKSAEKEESMSNLKVNIKEISKITNIALEDLSKYKADRFT